MKKLTTILLLLSNITFAQLPTQQTATQFDKFINKPEIEWAAYINDTISFERVNLNNLLLTRLSKNEIKASLPVGSGSIQADQIRYTTKKELDHLKSHNDEIAVFDSLGNMATKIKRQPYIIDTATFTITDITQILYVANGQLKTYIPWVATMLPVITSMGVKLGYGDYFSTCFNNNYDYRSPRQNKIIWLSQSKKKISLDSFIVRNKLKELYGRNLLLTLWPYILKNKISVFDYGNNKKLKPEELTTDLVNEEKQQVPVYDSTGNVTGFQFVHSALPPDVFTSAELVQNWYYDQTKNIVFTTTREVYLYAKKWTSKGEPQNASPILKLVFQ